MTSADEEILIRRYLLGNLTDDEQRRVEERLLTDNQYFDDLSQLEEGLIDAYVRGALTPDERRRFEDHFLNAPGRRESVAFAGVLNACLANRVSRPAVSQDPRVKSSTAPTRLLRGFTFGLRTRVAYLSTSITVALALAVVLLLIERTNLRKQIEQSHLEETALEQREDTLRAQLADQIARNKGLAQDLEHEQAERATSPKELAGRRHPDAKLIQPALVSLTLTPGRSRSEELSSTVTLSPSTRHVRLILTVTDPLFDRYTALLQTAGFETVLTRTNLKPQTTDGTSVIITIPARLLTGSDYLITLSGAASNGDQKAVATYLFNIARK